MRYYYALHSVTLIAATHCYPDLAAQPKKATRAPATIRKVLTTGTVLLLQRSLSQHLKEHVPPAALHAFRAASSLSQTALALQLLTNDLVSTLETLNSMDRVLQ